MFVLAGRFLICTVVCAQPYLARSRLTAATAVERADYERGKATDQTDRAA